jgi:hypothetical protein
MDSSNLTPEQAGKIRDILRPHAAYLRKLCDRMRQRGFPFYDDLFVATYKARDSVGVVLSMLNQICRPTRSETVGERAERQRSADGEP